MKLDVMRRFGLATDSRTAILGVVLLVSFTTNAAAQTPSSQDIQKFRERSESLRRGQIASLEHRLRGLTSGKIASNDRERELARVKADLSALRKGQRKVVPSIDFPLQVGAIGRLPGVGGHVERIVGPKAMLVSCSFPVLVTSTRHGQTRAVRVTRPVFIEVHGVETTDLHVGMDAPLVQVFAVTARRESDGVESFVAHVFEPELRRAGRR